MNTWTGRRPGSASVIWFLAAPLLLGLGVAAASTAVERVTREVVMQYLPMGMAAGTVGALIWWALRLRGKEVTWTLEGRSLTIRYMQEVEHFDLDQAALRFEKLSQAQAGVVGTVLVVTQGTRSARAAFFGATTESLRFEDTTAKTGDVLPIAAVSHFARIADELEDRRRSSAHALDLSEAPFRKAGRVPEPEPSSARPVVVELEPDNHTGGGSFRMIGVGIAGLVAGSLVTGVALTFRVPAGEYTLLFFPVFILGAVIAGRRRRKVLSIEAGTIALLDARSRVVLASGPLEGSNVERSNYVFSARGQAYPHPCVRVHIGDEPLTLLGWGSPVWPNPCAEPRGPYAIVGTAEWPKLIAALERSGA